VNAEREARKEPTGDAQPAVAARKGVLQSDEFAKIEKNLASLGIFTPSKKRIRNDKAKTITITKIVEGKKVEVRATIVPAAIYGFPIMPDQDKCLAFQKITIDIHQSEGSVTNPVGFTSAEILRLLKRDVLHDHHFQIAVYFAGMKV